MCPNESYGLVDIYGDDFDNLYLQYESTNKFIKQINIIDLWNEICATQLESGVPYIMYKDHVNRKCNQNNLGTIQSSNLCSEITIYTDMNNIGVCNLASVCLGKYIEFINEEPFYNYQKLYDVVYDMTINLNKVLESNYYSISEGEHSDANNKPLGIGVQGLADVFMQFKIPFTSNDARRINKYIFETMYFAALSASCHLAKSYGTYVNYPGSMIFNGLLQFDLWNVTPEYPEWNWDNLRSKISKHGLRNSLLIALMPTASTASIMGSSENFEPITSNIYARNVLSGKFQIVNKYLINDLIKLNLWNNEMKQMIIANNGSIQHIRSIPKELRDVYKTVYEYKLSDLIEMDRDRSAYVCQSSSSNRYIVDPSITKLTKMHIYAWSNGLKTSSYYIKTLAKADAIKFTIDNKIMNRVKREKQEIDDEEHESCQMCSA
jgi:ribonucleoside-diphosphate reductase alpha chain